MWMLKAKTWVAGGVLAVGLSATGGGLMLAGGQGPGTAPAPAAKPADSDADARRRALEWSARELERSAAEMDVMITALQKANDQAASRPGGAGQDWFEGLQQMATAREYAANCRGELVRVRGELAKLGVPPPAAAAVPAPPRLLKERIDIARRFVERDRAIREVGAISKEEAAAFEVNLRLTNQTLYEAVRAGDPSPAGHLAAAREWYVNTRDAELFYHARSQRGLVRDQVAFAATLARNQAETALLQAMAAAPPDARDRLAPFAVAPAGYSGKVTKANGMYTVLKPSTGLKLLTAVRVSRGGQPVGVLVVTHIAPDDVPPEVRGTAVGVMLPNADGTVPSVRSGDDVRP